MSLSSSLLFYLFFWASRYSAFFLYSSSNFYCSCLGNFFFSTSLCSITFFIHQLTSVASFISFIWTTFFPPSLWNRYFSIIYSFIFFIAYSFDISFFIIFSRITSSTSLFLLSSFFKLMSLFLWDSFDPISLYDYESTISYFGPFCYLLPFFWS